jgi:hypothetical protein
MDNADIHAAAVALGRKGGRSRSEKKRAASRRNMQKARGLVNLKPIPDEIRLPNALTSYPEYGAYRQRKSRCENPNHPDYKDYGARGIKFLFTSFEEFYAHIGPRPTAKHEVDRLNNDGNYEIGNVRWATHQENSANRGRTTVQPTLFATIFQCPQMQGEKQ